MVPDALQRSFERWQLAGRPDQVASKRNLQAWSRYFSEKADLLDSIPNPIDQQAMIDRATSIDGTLEGPRRLHDLDDLGSRPRRSRCIPHSQGH